MERNRGSRFPPGTPENGTCRLRFYTADDWRNSPEPGFRFWTFQISFLPCSPRRTHCWWCSHLRTASGYAFVSLMPGHLAQRAVGSHSQARTASNDPTIHRSDSEPQKCTPCSPDCRYHQLNFPLSGSSKDLGPHPCHLPEVEHDGGKVGGHRDCGLD